LLDVSLWFSNLSRVYGRESMGIHLQRGQLAMSRLRHIEPVCRVEERLIMNVEETYTWEGEVRDNETDLQGIVNNSNYQKKVKDGIKPPMNSLGV